MDCAVKYSLDRKAFGTPISNMYSIQEKIAEMSMRIDASRLLTWKAAMLADRWDGEILHDICTDD
jgi:butyryl-CoA dehydrogenase